MKFRGSNEVVYSVPAEEAHKAYYLWNTHQKGTFNNGLAIKGEDIERIEPDLVGSMGWNQGYKMLSEDYEESGLVKSQLEKICSIAMKVGARQNPQLNVPLSKLIKEDPQLLIEMKSANAPKIGGGMKQIGEI